MDNEQEQEQPQQRTDKQFLRFKPGEEGKRKYCFTRLVGIPPNQKVEEMWVKEENLTNELMKALAIAVITDFQNVPVKAQEYFLRWFDHITNMENLKHQISQGEEELKKAMNKQGPHLSDGGIILFDN